MIGTVSFFVTSLPNNKSFIEGSSDGLHNFELIAFFKGEGDKSSFTPVMERSIGLISLRKLTLSLSLSLSLMLL